MKRKANRVAVGVALAVVLVNALLVWSFSGGNGAFGTQAVSAGSAASAFKNRQEILVVHIPFHSLAERDRLANQWGAVEQSTAKGYITVYTDRPHYNEMLAAGLKVTIDQQTTDLVNNPHLFGQNSPDTFYGGFKTVEEMQTFLDTEVAAYPGLAEKVDIGDSWCKVNAGSCTVPAGTWNGYDLWVLHITNRSIPGPKPVYWYDAGIHAREIAVPEVAMRYIDYLLSNYNTDADAHWLVDYHDIWVMPMFNPDGHHIVEQGEPEGNGAPYYQRKNANDTNGYTQYPPSAFQQYGTDNNRNFEFLWNCCGGSSSDPSSQTYHGPDPSPTTSPRYVEPETLAVENKVRSLIPDQRGPNNTDPAPITTTGVYQNMHSNASLDLYPWGWTGSGSPNDTEMSNIAAHMAAPDAYPSGNSYQACQAPNCLYTVDGDAFDWAYGELGAASFTTEVDGNDFFVPLSYVDTVMWPDNKGALLYQAKIARTPYLLAHGPDAITDSAHAISVTQGATAHITATLNYNWSANTLAQNVGAAEYYIDTPPWAGGTAVAMSGTFGTQTVNASADINTTAIAPGRHIIFMRGRGVNNYQNFQTWGAVAAQFLDVLPVGGTFTPTPVPSATDTPGPATDTPTAAPTNTATPVVTPTSTLQPSVTPTDCPNPFVDITGNVFYTAIHYLNCRNVINGVDATHYAPGGTASRDQFTKIAVLAAGYPLTTPASPHFVDVPPSYWAYAYIETGYANGIVQGDCSSGPCYFYPHNSITRGQLTKIIVNAFHYSLYTPTTPDFIDVPPSNVFYVSIETAYHNGLVNGYPDHTFRPNNNIRRDEMAQIVYEGIVHQP